MGKHSSNNNAVEILRKHWYSRMKDDQTKKVVSTEAVKLNFLNNPNESHTKILKALQQKSFKIKNIIQASQKKN